MLRAPVGGLQGLVQREAEIAGGRGLQRGRVRAVEQAHGLQGAVDADRLDAALGEVAEVERRVVHDDRPLPDRREHGPVDLVQVDHGDAGAAAVERAEPDRRTVRIETGPPGMVHGALQRGELRLGDRERGASLPPAPSAPRRAAARRSVQACTFPFASATRRRDPQALPLARQRGGLEVDGDEAFPRIGDDLGDEGGRRRRVGGVGRPHLEVRQQRNASGTHWSMPGQAFGRVRRRAGPGLCDPLPGGGSLDPFLSATSATRPKSPSFSVVCDVADGSVASATYPLQVGASATSSAAAALSASGAACFLADALGGSRSRYRFQASRRCSSVYPLGVCRFPPAIGGRA